MSRTTHSGTERGCLYQGICTVALHTFSHFALFFLWFVLFISMLYIDDMKKKCDEKTELQKHAASWNFLFLALKGHFSSNHLWWSCQPWKKTISVTLLITTVETDRKGQEAEEGMKWWRGGAAAIHVCKRILGRTHLALCYRLMCGPL